MPQIQTPDYASVTPADGSQPLQNINVSADSFGAQTGAALQGLGRAVGSGADMLANHAMEYAKQAAEADANKALADHDVNVAERMSQFNLLEGKQKADAFPALRDDLSKMREDARGALTSPFAQRMFDQGSIRQFGYQIGNAASAAAVAQRKYNSEAAQARLGSSVALASHLNDDNQFDQQMSDDELRKGILADPGNAGKPPEVVDQMVRETRQKAYQGRIQATAYTDPERAYDMLKKHSADVDPTQMANLQKSVENILITRKSADVANQAVGGGPASGKAADIEKYAMQKLSPIIGKAGAAGIVGGWSQESSLNSKAVNPGDGSDGSDSIGFGQWNSTRAQNLKAFAAKAGADWHDPKTQVDFAAWELQNYPPAIAAAAKLRASQDPNETAIIARAHYEVAAPATANDKVRVANATRLFGSDISAQPVGAQGPGFREAAEKRAMDLAGTQADALGFGPDSKATFIERAQQATRAKYGQAQADYRDGVAGAKLTIAQALYPDQGDPPKNMDDFANSLGKEGMDAFNAMPAEYRSRVTNQITKNAVNPPLTEKGMAKYQTIRGMLENPETRPAIVQNPEQIWEDTDMPLSMKRELVGKAQALKTASNKPAPIDSAMNQLKAEGLFDSVDQLKKGGGTQANPNPAYAQYRGALTMAMEQYAQGGKGQPDGPTVSRMGKEVLAAMTRSQSTWWGLGTPKTVINPDATKEYTAGVGLDKQVPSSDFDQIGRYMRDKGRTPQPGDIYKIYSSPQYIQMKQRAGNTTTPAAPSSAPTQRSASAE